MLASHPVNLQVVVCSNTVLKQAMTVNELCHKHNIGFIKADIYGVFAGVFCDFGKQFHVLDVDGKWHCYTLAIDSKLTREAQSSKI